MSEDAFRDALHKVMLGLGDMKTLHVSLANAVTARCDRMKQSGKLERPSKEEVQLLARIDQLRCGVKQRCKEALRIHGVSAEDRKQVEGVIATLSNLREIDLTMGGAT